MQRWILALTIAAAAVLLADTADAQRRPVRPLPPRRPPTSTAVPELDPNAAGAALALLLGSVAVVLSSRRREA